jgi:hypothetical protein
VPKTATKTATPITPPSLRAKVLTAEPTPTCGFATPRVARVHPVAAATTTLIE